LFLFSDSQICERLPLISKLMRIIVAKRKCEC
jgi:hypothetical protein